MSEEDKSQKTEEATPKKLADERKKGNVPSSKEVGTVVSVFSLMIIVVFMVPKSIPEFSAVLKTLVEQSVTIEIGTSQQGLRDTGGIMSDLMMKIATIIGPLFFMMVVAAIFGVLVQGETVVTTERIKPKGSNISPMSGLKKIFGIDNFIEFLKSIVKVFVVGLIGYIIISSAVMDIMTGVLFVPESIPVYVKSNAGILLIIVACIFVPVAVADMIYKRMQWLKKNRMSMKEIKDEHKNSEGDPLLKAKRQEKRQELSRQRVTQAVPSATVILTNPTHYAVALRFERGVDPAPVCVAKGVDNMAKIIRDLAKENEVPIIENRPLARALYANVGLQEVIPADHWQTVAEIVSFVFDLKANIKRRPPEGSSVRDD